MPEGVKRNRFHPDDRVRATLSTCGRGACTYLQQIRIMGLAHFAGARDVSLGGPVMQKRLLAALLLALACASTVPGQETGCLRPGRGRPRWRLNHCTVAVPYSA